MTGQAIPPLSLIGARAPGTPVRDHLARADSHPRSTAWKNRESEFAPTGGRGCCGSGIRPRSDARQDREAEFAPTAGDRFCRSGFQPRTIARQDRESEFAPTAAQGCCGSGIRPRSAAEPAALESRVPGPEQSGFTLIETVVALVLIGIAGAALLSVFITPVANSADPQLIAQGRSIATAYMDEILLRDHGGGGCVGDTRATWETIWCYDGLNEAPRDQFGNAIGALADFTVNVAATGSGDIATVAVNVTHDSGIVNLTLESRRGNF